MTLLLYIYGGEMMTKFLTLFSVTFLLFVSVYFTNNSGTIRTEQLHILAFG